MSSVENSVELDLDIRQLLDQQADVQARLAALLAKQHGFSSPLELGMIRHKLHVLESLAAQYGLSSYIPVISAVEEARALQHRCETIEMALIQQDPNIMHTLRQSAVRHAPPNFFSWLDHNIEFYDPILRNRGFRGVATNTASESYKCWNERCLRYIYGFDTSYERDEHMRSHASPVKRDSAYL